MFSVCTSHTGRGDGALSLTVAIKVECNTQMTCDHPLRKLHLPCFTSVILHLFIPTHFLRSWFRCPAVRKLFQPLVHRHILRGVQVNIFLYSSVRYSSLNSRPACLFICVNIQVPQQLIQQRMKWLQFYFLVILHVYGDFTIPPRNGFVLHLLLNPLTST